jgi:hypothetical protein
VHGLGYADPRRQVDDEAALDMWLPVRRDPLWIASRQSECTRGPPPDTQAPGFVRVIRGETLDDTPALRPTTHYWTRSRTSRCLIAISSTKLGPRVL